MTNDNDIQRPAYRHKDDVRDAMRGEPGVDMWSVRKALEKHARFIEGTEHDDGLDYPVHVMTEPYASGDHVGPAHYRVHGPNGPVEYMNDGSEPYTVSMMSMVMDLVQHGGREVSAENTPWGDDT